VRVGLVCPYSLTVPGGVQGQVLGLARALRDIGIEARVLGPCDGPPPAPWVTALGASIPTASNGSMAPIAPDPAAALRTIRALRDESFDVVHLHEPVVPGPPMTALMSADAPLIGTFHRSGAFWLAKTVAPIGRRLAARLAVRCAVSEEAASTAAVALGGEYELVWNGIDVERFAATPPWPRPEGPGEPESPIVLFLGRHEERKGLAVLLDALALLGPQVRLWVIGDGPQSEDLRRATADDRRIEWLGRVDEEEKCQRLRAADVLCVPSLYGESFGVVLAEGMAAGTVVVASDLPGYRRVARPGSGALLVPPGRVDALAAALRDAWTPGSRREERVAAGSRRVAELSMARLANRYGELYTRVLGTKGPAR
jgi:phosphatidylinositol alpha-mannosyltransferase